MQPIARSPAIPGVEAVATMTQAIPCTQQSSQDRMSYLSLPLAMDTKKNVCSPPPTICPMFFLSQQHKNTPILKAAITLISAVGGAAQT
jgi:hypothetical protein